VRDAIARRRTLLLIRLGAGFLTASAAFATLAGSAAGDLRTFGYSNDRLGTMIDGRAISPAGVPRLRTIWRTNLGAGAINTQPLVADGVTIGHRRHDLVFIGTEHGQIAAIDEATGKVQWRRTVGSRVISPGCQASPDGVFGVSATFALDRRAGRLYAVDADGRAWALELANGRTVKGWPVRVHPVGAEFVWGALTLSRGWLYVPIASLCDSGHYDGGITSVRLDRPRQIRRWHTTAGTAAYAGGIWGWGGVSVDARSGDVYAATGNSLGTATEDDGFGEHVVRLSASLRVKQSNDPLHGPYQITDRDFGTTPVLFHAAGCPAELVAINKSGELFLYDSDDLAAGPRQRLVVAADNPGDVPLYGMPAFDPASRTLVLLSPSTPPLSDLRAGVQAFRLTPSCDLALRWQHRFDSINAGSAPAIAGGIVYIASGHTGWLRAFRLRDGGEPWARHLSSEPIFGAPSVVDGTLLAAGWSGDVWAFRPSRAERRAR